MSPANSSHHVAFHKGESHPTNGIAFWGNLPTHGMGRHGNLPHSYPPAVDEAGDICGQGRAIPGPGRGKGVVRCPEVVGINARWPVSRVLSSGYPDGWPFIWDAGCPAPHATNPGGGAETRLAPDHPNRSGISGDGGPCRPYSVLLPVGFTVPPLLPGARCALTAPFHPYRRHEAGGGLLSVALSLGSPPPAVSRHRVSVEPGLSSPDPKGRRRPSGHLARQCVQSRRVIRNRLPAVAPAFVRGDARSERTG